MMNETSFRVGQDDGFSVDSEVARRARRGGGRRGRRAGAAVARAVESLEQRRMLSATITPTVSNAQTLASVDGAVGEAVIKADPTDATHLVAFSLAHTTAGGDAYAILGSYSIDSGVSWTNIGATGTESNPATANGAPFALATDLSVGFDRLHNVYVTTLQTTVDSTQGEIVLEKFDFSGGAAAAVGVQVVRSWNGSAGLAGGATDAALSPTMVVDDNPRTNGAGVVVDPTVDATTGQGPLYIAWTTRESEGANQGNYNPNAIQMISSSDGGLTFSPTTLVSPSGYNGGARASAPRLAVSAQATDPASGSITVVGGHVTLVWDDLSTSTAANATDAIRATTITGGVSTAVTVMNTTIMGRADSNAATPTVTDIALDATNATPLTSLSDLSVSLSISNSVSLAQLQIELVDPAGDRFTLVAAASLNGASLGVMTVNNAPVDYPAQFTSAAKRTIVQGPAPYTGDFVPSAGSTKAFAQTVSGTGQINGVWHLVITNNDNASPKPVDGNVDFVTLHLVQDQIASGAQSAVGTTTQRTTLTGNVLAAGQLAYSYGANSPANFAVSPDRGVGPGLSIAADNTLATLTRDYSGGSEFVSGRIYVTYVSRDAANTANPAYNTDIYLAFSDDGGQTWTSHGTVNDDYLNLAGSSAAGVDGGGAAIAGRTQFLPTIAVDQSTGNVGIAWYDGRDDASRTRVATYVAVSTDGGGTFLPQVYANVQNAVTDGITGKSLSVGPDPANFSAAITGQQATARFQSGTVNQGFGNQLGLAYAGGLLHPAWISNDDGGFGQTLEPYSLQTATVAATAGPRIISGTAGPVTADGAAMTSDGAGGLMTIPFNNTFAADGSRQLNGFVITFDRYVLSDSVDPASVSIRYRTTSQFGDDPGTAIPVTAVTPLFADDEALVEEQAYAFLVTFAAQSGVGTYSYAILPTAADELGNLQDQNGDGVGGQVPADGPTTDGAGDVYAAPGVAEGSSYVAASNYFTPAFDITSQPLIITGPRLVGSVAIGTTTTAVTDPTGNTSSLVLNDTVGKVRVTFDRAMNPATLNGSAIERIIGPNGPIDGPQRYNYTTSTTIPGRGVPRQYVEAKVVVDSDYLAGDVNVQVSIDQAAVGDLQLTLIAPDGTAVPLAANVTASGANFTNTLFDDNSTTAIGAGTAPYQIPTGYRPASPLSALIGKHTRGTWKLRVENTVSTDTGTLKYFSLIITPSATSFGVAPVAGTNNTQFDVTFPAQKLSGAYTVTFNSTAKSAAGDALDQNANAGLPSLRETSTQAAATAVTTYQAGQVPVAIQAAPTNASTGAVIGSTTQTSSLVIPDGFTLTDLTPQLYITYPNDPDIKVELISPTGTAYTLFDRVGATGARANFTGTAFNNAATTPIANGSAPFLGTFKPQSTLPSTGSEQGTWQLRITNYGTSAGSLAAWSLQVTHSTVSTGAGEGVADDAITSFRIFTFATTKTGSSANWTSVGSSNTNYVTPFVTYTNAVTGSIGGLAVDPSDSSGNTVYAGGASGGVWKTENFLDATGQPVWVAVADGGPTASFNIGSIAVFPRNNDTQQSVVFAATGNPDADDTAPYDATAGVGFLRSTDGGRSWIVLDSSRNTDAGGNVLAQNDAARDHVFVGATIYKVVVDPRPTISGDVIAYAAVAGNDNQAGLWRTFDSGRTWTRVFASLFAGANNSTVNLPATDVTLDLNSAYVTTQNNPAGNVQNVYLAIGGYGVFLSPNRGSSWNYLGGATGNTLKFDGELATRSALVPLTTSTANPFFNKGRITLARPALIGPSDVDGARKNLLYEGWTYALVAAADGSQDGLYVTKDSGANWTKVRIPSAVTANINVPTNDTTAADVNLITGLAQTLTVDPQDPSIVYVGGAASLIRVDISVLADPDALYLSHSDPAGTLPRNSTTQALNSASLITLNDNNPNGAPDPLSNPYVNLLSDPADTDSFGGSFEVRNTRTIANSGAGARWQFIASAETIATGGFHEMYAMVDPQTGLTRLVMGNDSGVYTSIDDVYGDATLSGLSYALNTRNGNLSLAQLTYGAAQPGLASALQAAQSYLYVTPSSGDGYGFGTSDVVDTGDTTGTRVTGPHGGVATDQTGSGTFYQYYEPIVAGQNLFQVGNGAVLHGRVGGLLTNDAPNNYSGDSFWIDQGRNNFAVNPVSGNQIVIASNVGEVFATETQGQNWSSIADPADIGEDIGGFVFLQPVAVPALAYGAPDPMLQGNDATNFFIYVGTANFGYQLQANGPIGDHPGGIYVTFNGGGQLASTANDWINLSAGLDGSTVRQIVTNPTRASHEAYAVTDQGVYHMLDAAATGAAWVPLSDPRGISFNAYGDPNQAFTTGKQITSIQADWRYRIPDAADPTRTFPVLYVSTDGGVLRSLDDGATWQPFPNQATDGAAAEGGLLPSTAIEDIDLSLGPINPTTGYPNSSAGENLLLASTFGRGTYAIRIAPVVIPSTIAINPLDDTGTPQSITDAIVSRVATPRFTGRSEASAYGNIVHVSLVDLTNPANPRIIGGYDPADTSTFAGSLTTDQGAFSVQVKDGALAADGIYTIGFQATDARGVVSYPYQIRYQLTTVAPAAPQSLALAAGDDTGLSATDGVTMNPQPTLVGLADSNSEVDVFEGAIFLGSVISTENGDWAFQVPTRLTDGQHTFTAREVDQAGNTSVASASLVVTIDTVPPQSFPAAPSLLAADDSGSSASDGYTSVTLPRFTGVSQANLPVTVIVDGSPVTLVGQVVADSTGHYSFQLATPLADGPHTVAVQQQDLAGNNSPTGPAVNLTVDTGTPAAPTAPIIRPADDQGPSNSDGVTNVKRPVFTGAAEPGATVRLYLNGTLFSPSVTGAADALTGTYTFQLPVDFPDGTYTVAVTQTDLAGNTSIVGAASTITINTAVPPAPSGLSLAGGEDTGISATDNLTSRAQPAIIGVAEPSTQLDVYDGAVKIGSTVVRVNGTWSFTPPVALADGVHTLTAREVNVAGSTSAASGSLVVTIDTTPPNLAAPALLAADDTGSSNTDGVTSVKRPRFTGTAEPSQPLTVYVDGVVTPIAGGVIPDGTGAYSFQLPSDLTVGTHTVAIQQTDAAGNRSAVGAAKTVVIDFAAPAAPGAPAILAADDHGKSSTDGVTNVSRPRFTGLGEANAVISVFVDGSLFSPQPTVTADASGNYTFQLAAAFADGTHTVQITQRDAAGNTSSISATGTILIDTVAPVVTALPLAPTKGTPFSGTVANFTDAHPNGTATIDYGDGQTGAGTLTVNPDNISGSVRGSNTFVRSGAFPFSVTVVDLAGNAGTGTATVSVSAPAVLVAGVNAISATEAMQTPVITVANFSDPTGAEASTSYNATINWGDGTAADAGTIIPVGGAFAVSGSHRYGEDGNYTITVTVSRNGLVPATATTQASVANQPVTLTGRQGLTATSGVGFTAEVASFTEPGDAPQLSDFAATIDYGDGTSAPGIITIDASNPKLFHVFANAKLFSEPQAYTLTVTVTNEGQLPVSATSTVTVDNAAPVPSATIPPLVFAGQTASYTFSATDISAQDTAAGFSFLIDFGDGTAATQVNAATNGNATSAVINRAYANAGTYTILITATDRLGASATISRQVTVAAIPTITGVSINDQGSAQGSVNGTVTSVTFTLTATGTTLPNITTADLTLLRDGRQPLAIPAGALAYANGVGRVDLSGLALPDGDYELQIHIPNGPTRAVDFSRLAGDLNGDGIVNKADAAMLKSKLGTTAGSAAYLASADLDGNGTITATDAALEKKLNGHKLAKVVGTVKYNAAAPTIKIPKVSFKAKRGGAITAEDIILTNPDGTRALNLSGINFSGNGQFTFQVIGQQLGSATASIPPGGAIRLRFYLEPTVAGTYTSFVIFTAAHDGEAARTITLAATAKIS